MPQNARPQTPPPIEDPIVDGDAERWDWYYNSNAGGMIVPFKKYEGQHQPLHSVPLPYLLYCAGTTRRTAFLAAFERYLEGINAFLTEGYNYEKFLVPFGKKHRGLVEMVPKAVVLDRQDRAMKHPLFFLAVEKWLANPQKIEQTRHVGELLSRTQYEDDFNLKGESGEEDEDEDGDGDGDESAQSDTDTNLSGFIASDSEPIEVEGGREEDSQESEEDTERLDRFLSRTRSLVKKRKRNKSTPSVKRRKRPQSSEESDSESSDVSDGAEAYKEPDSPECSAGPSTERPRTRSFTHRSEEKKRRGMVNKSLVCSECVEDLIDPIEMIHGTCEACRTRRRADKCPSTPASRTPFPKRKRVESDASANSESGQEGERQGAARSKSRRATHRVVSDTDAAPEFVYFSPHDFDFT
ncbi:hypothetical protein DFH09DRAFT_1069936 [Mycena vulgaris]|nr:hypothetical protein DFH09DRAFT_1069936 [Mycena vulgaris]